MQEAAEIVKRVPIASVGSLPDRMARELNEAVEYGKLQASYDKEAAATHLYLTGFPMSDVVEYIDDAIAKVRT